MDRAPDDCGNSYRSTTGAPTSFPQFWLGLTDFGFRVRALIKKYPGTLLQRRQEQTQDSNYRRHCARRDHFDMLCSQYFFRPARQDCHILQIQIFNDGPYESRLLADRLTKGELCFRQQYRERNSRKARSGPGVQNSAGRRKERARAQLNQLRV